MIINPLSSPLLFAIKPVTSLVLAACLLGSANQVGHQLRSDIPHSETESEPTYLPKPELVKLVTLGYDAAVADGLWFLTVNYFGRSFRERGDFRWLSHYCSITTELNPNAIDRYEFCATLISWMAKNPSESTTLLTAGIDANPNNWRLRYLRSFNYWFFLKDPEKGAEDLRVAATLPQAPQSLGSIASRLLSTAGDPQLAVDYLEESMMRTESEAARSALAIRLRQAVLSRDLKKLNDLANNLEQQLGRQLVEIEELISNDLIDELPPEPFGGEYILDSDLGKIISTSGKKGLELLTKK